MSFNIRFPSFKKRSMVKRWISREVDPQIIGIPIIFTPSIVMDGHFGPYTWNWRLSFFTHCRKVWLFQTQIIWLASERNQVWTEQCLDLKSSSSKTQDLVNICLPQPCSHNRPLFIALPAAPVWERIGNWCTKSVGTTLFYQLMIAIGVLGASPLMNRFFVSLCHVLHLFSWLRLILALLYV